METPTLIVGAGPAGLAVAGRLRQAGLDFAVIEKSDRVGDAWHRHYDRLHLHTVKQLSHLPGLDFPEQYPRYVPRKELADYYRQYADVFSIEPMFGEEAEEIVPSGNKWLTTTQGGLEISSDHVVVATGLNRVPPKPELCRRGRVRRSTDPCTGLPRARSVRRATSAGGGYGEHRAPRSRSTSARREWIRPSRCGAPINIVPRDVLGRPTQLTARMLARLPTGLADWLGSLLRRMTVGDLTAYGIATPEIAPLAQLRVKGKTPVIDVGTVSRIKKGLIAVRPGIDHFEADMVVFTDGRKDRYDTVIFATGYRPMLEEILNAGDDALDENGLPHQVIGEGPSRGLFFVGFDNHRPGGVLGTVFEESETVVDRIRET